MDSHQRHVRLRERQKGRAMDTGGMWGSGVLVEVLGVDGQSFWNEMMRSRKSEEIRSDVEIVQCI